jgi:molecular chaperone DnaK
MKAETTTKAKHIMTLLLKKRLFLSTNSPIKIQEKSDELQSIIGKIRWRNPDFLTGIFQYWLKTINQK